MDPQSEELLAFLAEVGLQGYASNILHTHQFTSLKQMQELIITDEDVLSLGVEPLAHRKVLLAGLKKKVRRGSTRSTVVATITPPAPLASRRDILVGGVTSSAPAGPLPPPQPNTMDLSQRSSNMSMSSQLLTPHLEEASLVTARSVVQTLTQLTSGMDPRGGIGGAAASPGHGAAQEARQRMQSLVSSLHAIVSAELIPALIRDVEGVVGRYEEILNEVVLSSRDTGMRAIIGGYEDLLDGDELRDLQEVGKNLPTSIMVDIGISMVGEEEDESDGSGAEEDEDKGIPECIVPPTRVSLQNCRSENTSPVPLRQPQSLIAEAEKSTSPCGYGDGGGDSLPSCASSTSTLVVPSDNAFVADFVISQATTNNDVDMLSPVGRPTLPPDHITRSISPATAKPIRQPPPPSPLYHHQPTTSCPTLAEIDAMSAADVTSMCDQLGLQYSYTDTNEEDDWFEDMVAACAEGDDQPVTPSQCIFLERSRSPDSRRPSNANRLRLKQLALRQEFASVALADLFGDLPNWRDRFPKSRSPTPPTTLTQSQAVDLLPRGEREKARKRLRVEDEQEANHQIIMALAAHSAAWVVDGLDPRLGADAGVQQHLSLFEKAVLREATSTPDMLAVAKEHLPSTTLGRVTSILTASGVPVISQKDSQAKASFFASKWRRKRFGGR